MILLIATNTDRLYTGCDALRMVYTALRSNVQVLAEIRDQLSAVTGMDDICHSLLRLTDAVDAQAGQSLRLFQSLDIICQTYVSCENRILDRCENALVYYEQPKASFVDLSSATALLRELSFHMDEGDAAWQQDALK